ncbi:MAG TPA: ankyrin repeat domain-containing protein [Candidatus Babeliales bacterium]|nr:ankyrin repeat domain-containing protein [Candidatus Babeliales bacterium]
MYFYRLLSFLLLLPISAFAGNFSLHHYASDGRVDLLDRVLKLPEGGQNGRGSVNARRNGATPLHVVPEGPESGPKIRLLLGAGADASLQNKCGFTPLTDAISGQDCERFLALSNEGNRGGINAQDSKGRTPLNWVMRRHPRSVSKKWKPFYDERETADTLLYLLDRKANSVIPDDTGQTPMHWAARLGCSESVLALGKHMPSTTVLDEDGLTPLHRAIYNYAALVGVKQPGEPFLRDAKLTCERVKKLTKEEAAKVCVLLLSKTDPDKKDSLGVSSTNLLYGLLGVNRASDIVAQLRARIPDSPVLDMSNGILELDVRSCANQLALPVDKFECSNKFHEYDPSKSKEFRLALLGLIEPRNIAHSGDPNAVDKNGMTALMWLCHLDTVMPVDMRRQLDLYLELIRKLNSGRIFF